MKKRLVKSNRIRLGSIRRTNDNKSVKQNIIDRLKRFTDDQIMQNQNSPSHSSKQNSAQKRLRFSVLKKFQILP